MTDDEIAMKDGYESKSEVVKPFEVFTLHEFKVSIWVKLSTKDSNSWWARTHIDEVSGARSSFDLPDVNATSEVKAAEIAREDAKLKIAGILGTGPA